ncbi:hypothetical protein JCM10213_002818 [Rhodosporidiobolus nylandii]
MLNSVLHTAEVPSFDPATGQLTLAQHHLVSAPLSLLASLPEDLDLLLDPPPARPYQQTVEESSHVAVEPRRKRRRIAPPAESASPADWALQRQKQERRTTTDRATEEHHASISLDVETAIDAVRGGWLGREKEGEGWMGDLRERVEWVERGKGSDKEEVALVDLAKRFSSVEGDEQDVLRVELAEAELSLDQLFNRIVLNASPSASSILRLQDSDDAAEPKLPSLLLPPSSAFLLRDFSTWSAPSSDIASLGRTVGGWDIVVIDPPWPNASASRSSSYDTFDAYDLWKLDLPALLGETPALVAVWLTNKVKFRRLVTEKLFPAWGVKNIVSWYWVKIASETGEPVVPLDAKHRRCYEGLVIGYYVPPAAKLDLPALPDGKVFLSTPIGHSRKPVLLDLLRPYLPSPSNPPNVLELFARTALSSFPSLASGEGEKREAGRGTFLAVGNEAVKFNVLEEDNGTARGWLRRRAVGNGM